MKPKSIELLAFDRNHELQYEGKCKLMIDTLSSLLLVEPENEECKLKSAMFKWDFVIDKNILFVIADHELSDFALVFHEERKCKKVFDFICKYKAKNDNGMIFQRFLIPICDKMAKNDETTSELKRILVEWINKHDEKEKQELIRFLKDNNAFDAVYPSQFGEKEGDKNGGGAARDKVNGTNNVDNGRGCNLRKRRHSMVKSSQRNNISFQNKKQKGSKNCTVIIRQSEYELVVPVLRIKVRRLLTFADPERNNCFEYFWSHQTNQFYCIKCREERNDFVAIFAKDESGVDCIKTEDKNHACTPIPYTPEKYVEMKIIKKPYYEILENCNSVSGNLLIIFDENDKNKCWEFKFVKKDKCYRCRHCLAGAKIWNEKTENEFVELRDVNHQCKYISYDTKNYYEFKEFVLPPDFEVQTYTKNGEEKKRLIIFDKNDRNLCLIYNFGRKFIYCIACAKKRWYVTAKILQNSDDENYVILSTRKHICKLRMYSELSRKEIILRPPDFELMENTENGTPKLFIFDSIDRNLCYIFSRDNDKNRYLCCGCKCISRKNKRGKILSVKLLNDKNGDYYVRLSDSTHACEPTKYEPEKYAKKEIQKCYDYFFFRPKNRLNRINVAIYHPENKKLCFKLNYNKTRCHFLCNACKVKRKSFKTEIEKDESGKEYFIHDYKKHVCQPVKVSSIRAPEFVILKRNEIIFKEKEKKKPEIDESKIVKLPNFELRPNAKGDEDGSLFIFLSEDKSMGNEFFSVNGKYLCCKKSVCYTNAKLQCDENGEKYVIMGKSEHKCEPVKYKNEENTINSSDFIVIPKSNDNKGSRIIVFSTPERDLCYEFISNQIKNTFQCIGCCTLRRYVSVKLCKNENGQEYLTMPKKNHECQLRKYIKEKYEPKTVINNNELFELRPNTKGIPDKTLVVFISAKKDFVREYIWYYSDCYICTSCKNRKHNVTVKLIENGNGIKSIQLSEEEHICEPRKYDPTKYVYSQPKILSSDSFVLHNGSDECKKKNRGISAKLIENDDGSKSVKLSPKEHVCEPKKYDPKKYAEPKIISNDLFTFHDGSNGEKYKYLIIFTSEKKNVAYKFVMEKGGYYRCHECKRKNMQSVSANVIHNKDGTKSIKLGKNEHGCKPQKYDPKNFKA